ncbi:peptide-binding protein [Leucothrix mucor]|uniref:peptide-binding protein n=1 Tax=Leucothrix mucor TaxID=45248 RepID=UPI0003B34AEB|nr:peptide-binding protein [Leucothrix mucor]
MQKRLTARDVILYVLLTLIVLLLILVMYQVDRQWNKLTEMQVAVTEQAKDVHDVRNTVSKLQQSWNEGLVVQQVAASDANGKVVASGGSKASGTIPESFRRAYQASQQESYAEGDWKVDTFGNTLKTITPYVSSDVYASEVQAYVLESLLTRDPDTLEWTGLIAKSWTVSDGGLVINFKLNSNVTFSDGKPLTAEDVAFTYDFMMNEGINAPGERAYYEKVKSVTAKGPYEVEFVFKDPYFEALGAAGGIPILAKHFYEEYMTKTEAFNNSKGLLIGSGPYRLADPKSWSSEQGTVELVRNPRYWGSVQPSFDKMVWRIIQNDSARLTTYRNGDIDVYSARPIEYDRLLQDEQIKEKSHNFEYMSPTAGYSYIGWNQQSGEQATRFADKRVRQAMTYLTDRDTIIRDIYRGYAEAAISPFSPRSKQHDPALLPRKADVDKAKALLKEAGYEDRDNDGLLEDAAGEPFSFKLMYSQGSDDTKSLVLLLKDMYAKAGVQLVPEPTEWSVMLERLDTKNFDATILGWSSGFETDIYQMFHSSQAKTGGNNFISYRSKELDSLIDEARVIVDESKRMPVWQKAEAVFYEDQPYTFLMRRKSLVFLDKRIENVDLTPSGLNLNFQPVEIFVPKAAQKYQ